MNWMNELGWHEKQIDDLRYLGYSYIRQGVYPAALIIFEALEVLIPNHAYDLQILGALHLQLGNGMRALDYLDRAIKFDPESLETHLNRAKTLLILGYRRQGIMQAMELEHCPNPNIGSQAKALLMAYQSPLTSM